MTGIRCKLFFRIPAYLFNDSSLISAGII